MNNRRNFLGGLAGIFGIGAADAAARSTLGTAPDAMYDAAIDGTAKSVPHLVESDWIPNAGEPCRIRESRRVVTARGVYFWGYGRIEVIVDDGGKLIPYPLGDLCRLTAPPANVSATLLGGKVPAGGVDLDVTRLPNGWVKSIAYRKDG